MNEVETGYKRSLSQPKKVFHLHQIEPNHLYISTFKKQTPVEIDKRKEKVSNHYCKGPQSTLAEIEEPREKEFPKIIIARGLSFSGSTGQVNNIRVRLTFVCVCFGERGYKFGPFLLVMRFFFVSFSFPGGDRFWLEGPK